MSSSHPNSSRDTGFSAIHDWPVATMPFSSYENVRQHSQVHEMRFSALTENFADERKRQRSLLQLGLVNRMMTKDVLFG